MCGVVFIVICLVVIFMAILKKFDDQDDEITKLKINLDFATKQIEELRKNIY